MRTTTCIMGSRVRVPSPPLSAVTRYSLKTSLTAGKDRHLAPWWNWHTRQAQTLPPTGLGVRVPPGPQITLPGWWNWQTQRFKEPLPYGVRVRVPPRAQTPLITLLITLSIHPPGCIQASALLLDSANGLERWTLTPKVAGSTPAPATTPMRGLYDKTIRLPCVAKCREAFTNL